MWRLWRRIPFLPAKVSNHSSLDVQWSAPLKNLVDFLSKKDRWFHANIWVALFISKAKLRARSLKCKRGGRIWRRCVLRSLRESVRSNEVVFLRHTSSIFHAAIQSVRGFHLPAACRYMLMFLPEISLNFASCSCKTRTSARRISWPFRSEEFWSFKAEENSHRGEKPTSIEIE